MNSPIGSFIDGYFQGDRYRDDKEERKRRREMADKAEKRAQESHEASLARHELALRRGELGIEDGQLSLDQRREEITRAQEERDFLRSVLPDDEPIPTAVDAPETPVPPTDPETPARVRAPRSDRYADTGRESVADVVEDVPVPERTPSTPRVGSSAAPTRDVTRGRGAIPPEPRAAAAMTMQMHAERIGAPPELKALAEDGDAYREMVRTDRHPQTGAPLNAREKAALEAEIGEIEGFLAQFEGSGHRQVGPEGIMTEAPGAPVAPQADTAPTAPRGSAGPADIATPTGLPETSEGTPIASAETAMETAPERAVLPDGQRAGQEPTKAQREKATKTFVERYVGETAPKIVEFYLQRGDIEKAEQFQAFIGRQETKAGLKAWAEAVHAAQVGDEEGFMRSLEKTYNAKGYYDDGYSVLEGQSGLLKDDAGNVTGAEITYRNDDTGETFTRSFESTEDLYRLGVKALSPEEIFEQMHSEVQAAREIEAKVRAQLAAKGVKDNDQRTKAVMNMMKVLADGSGFATEDGPTPYKDLPIEEQISTAERMLDRLEGRSPRVGASTGTDVPVYR